jgi:hypothetical protein
MSYNRSHIQGFFSFVFWLVLYNAFMSYWMHSVCSADMIGRNGIRLALVHGYKLVFVIGV